VRELETARLTAGNTKDDLNSIGVLIPCYNEESRIASVIVKCLKFVGTVYVCDDGSTDLTAEIASRMGAVVIKHKNNMGYGAALRSLFDAAADSSLKVVVTIDGDGQHDPSDIQQLIKPILNQQADVVIGSRFFDSEKRHSNVPGYRRFGIKVINGTTNLVNSAKVSDTQSGFRAYDTRILRRILPSEMGMAASTEILMKASSENLRIEETPVEIRYYSDSSTHNPILHGFDVVLSTFKQYSVKHALLSYGLPGVILLAISAFFWTGVLGYYETTKLLETNFALVAIALTIIGLMMISTGIILWTLINVVRSLRLSKD
jgi:glycosyltransferase involved in cell wall biosynthesis